MLTTDTFIQVFSIIATAVRGTNTGIVPYLDNYTPLEDTENRYVPKNKDVWQHYLPQKDISASVADYILEDGVCQRVVVFIGQKGPMEDVKVSCNLSEPFIGLMHIKEKLWYFGTVFVRRHGKKNYDYKGYKNKFIVVKANDDIQTCEKNWWIINRKSYDDNFKAFGKSPSTVKLNEDKDCEEVITQQDLPPMMLYSPKGDIGKLQPSNEWKSFNQWEAVGAKIREYRKGVECVQLLVFTSYGRPVDAMKVACSPLQGVTMTEKAFYYGKTAMVMIHDDLDMFTVFYNPRNGREDAYFEEGNNRRVLPNICIKKTFRLVNNKEKYFKKKISTVVEFILGPDCTKLVKGDFREERTWMKATEVQQLVQSLNGDNLKVDAEIQTMLNGYKNLKRIDDFNVANEMGIVVMPFEKQNDKLNLVLALARGVVLTGVVLQPKDKEPLPLIIRGDELIYSHNLMVRKSSSHTFTLFKNNGGVSCDKITYNLQPSTGKSEDKTISEINVDRTVDTYCQALLEGSLILNPEAERYNTKHDASQHY